MKLSILPCAFFIFLIYGNAISQSNQTSLHGVFDGRTPCFALARQLREKTAPDCIKIKWRLALYVDSLTRKPSAYTLVGFVYKKEEPRKGNWTILRGSAEDPKAVIYKLDAADGGEPLFFQKGDDNVLFFLDQEKRLMAGNRDFSYTLNRVK